MIDNKLEVIRAWLIKADHDLGTAEMIIKHLPLYKDMVCFHCQQAVEKYLKTYLLFLEISFPKTHNLVLLLDLINVDPFPDEYYNLAKLLQEYAVEIRYPTGRYMPNEIKIDTAIEAARKFRQTILLKLKMPDFKE